MEVLVKIQARALQNNFSPICRLNVTSLKENYMIDKHKKFQLFSFSTLPIAVIVSVRFACHRVCTGVNELCVVHISMGTFFEHKDKYYSEINWARELKFSVKVQVIITVTVVIFAKSF